MRAATLMALALIAAQANGASSTWIHVSSPSIDLFTDSGERTARTIVKRFQTLHRIFNDAYTGDSPAPLRVYLFASEEEFQQYRATASGNDFYMSDGDGEFIVLDERGSLQRAATHEYLHMVMHHASPLLPGWLGEGLAEFYSTISVTSTKMRVGDPIDSALATLRQEKWLSADDLALNRHADSHIFYAESWALVHMLSLAPAWRDGMPRFVKLLSEGREQQDAFSLAFGKTMTEALAAVPGYLVHPQVATTAAPTPGAPVKYRIVTMARVDAMLMLADLAQRTNHPTLARSLFLEAAKIGPKSPEAVAGLGSLALAENRKDDARRQFEKAIATGNRDPAIYLEMAMLTKDDTFLDRALGVDPNFAEAHFLLGVHATDRGDTAIAIEHLQRAVAIEPRHFTYWNALAYAQSKAGDRLGVAASARRATLIASSGQEEKMAADLTQLALDVAPAIMVKKAAVNTPASWQNPKGDTHAEGTLTWVDCDSSPVRLVVSTSTPSRTIELNVLHPGEVELLNAEGISTTLACGEQSRPVAIEYVAATKGITKIEFQHVIMKR